VGIETKFLKKADSISTFICEDNRLAQEKINETIKTGEGQTFTMISTGYNAANEIISESRVTWSVKKRRSKK
jgi:hypothetical protein